MNPTTFHARIEDEIAMKVMTCRQLGGACDQEFKAQTFEEMAELSKQHGMQMLQNNDTPHMEAMQSMAQMMQDPRQIVNWMENKKAEFDALPESN